MNLGLSTGYTEGYWGAWPWTKMYGGSERIVVEVASALASQGHSVTVRLPYQTDERAFRGVRWIGVDAPQQRYDVLFCADDFARRDSGTRTALVACRSDPPPHMDFDQLIFLSRHHAELMGHPDRPYVGGGVDLADYAESMPRVPNRVICTSSPDRCPRASAIGRTFDFVHTYRPVGDIGRELDRAGLIEIQKSAQVHIYPLDPIRPSDFFSMAVLESHAAGTPVVVSDADSMRELWGDSAIVLPRPIRLSEWVMTVEDLMADRQLWDHHSRLGRLKARDLTWDKQAQRYLDLAMEA